MLLKDNMIKYNNWLPQLVRGSQEYEYDTQNYELQVMPTILILL